MGTYLPNRWTADHAWQLGPKTDCVLRRQGMRFKVLLVLVIGLATFHSSVAANDPSIPKGPLVVSDRWPECTSLQTWMRDILRLEGVERAPETTQAKVFFKWLRLFSKMATGGMIQAHEGSYGKELYVLDAHKNLFVYGWGYCDTHSRIAEAAWSEYKKDPQSAERVVVQHEDGGYHTMYRLRLDGRYAAFDARYGYYLIDHDAPDAQILDWAEVGQDQNILANQGYRYRSAPFFEFFGKEWERAFLLQPRYFDTEEAWIKAGSPVECVFGNRQYEMGAAFHDMSFWLPKGTVIERFWDNSARKFYVPAGFETKGEEPFRPSGRFYRVTESMLDGNWVRRDPNYEKCAPYVTKVPTDEGYNAEVSGGRTIGQAWGRLTYMPELGDTQFLQVSAVSTDFAHRTNSPFLRPVSPTGGGQATFDFYCPYVLVDGVLSGEWVAGDEDQPAIELRALLPKPGKASEPDVWSPWQKLQSGTRVFRCELGRSRFNNSEVSIHGRYRFQIRFSLLANPRRLQPSGLKALRLESYFENGIMSIPRIEPGHNTIHFQVRDAASFRGPVGVTYDYETGLGQRRHRKVLLPRDFKGNVATYSIEAPGLVRCRALKIEY